MLDFIIAALTAALSATGVGGGGLLVLYLRLVRNTEQLCAQGINLAFFTVSSVFAVLVHCKKRKLNFPLIFIVGILGFAGAFVGLCIVKRLDVGLLQKAFGALIALCGAKTLFTKVKK